MVSRAPVFLRTLDSHRWALLWLGIALAAPLPCQEPAATPEAPFDWVAAVQPETEWHRQPIGQGVFMWSRRFAGPDGKPQSITVVKARLDPPMVRLDVVAGDADGTPDKHPTSWFGEQEQGSVAAINGGFFNVKTGDSLGLLRVDGTTVHPSLAARSGAAVGVSTSGALRFAERPEGDGWESMEDAMHAGPMLLVEDQVRQGSGAFWANRHPRSAIGITAQNDAILVVVDGRTEQAVGMSLDELAQVMLALGCVDAMNLDGGGSSAMWARTHGVVSHPCDNKAFDHVGERKVANAIVLRAPLVRVLDDAEVVAVPDSWKPTRSDRALGGTFMAYRLEGPSSLAWQLELPAGRYRLRSAGLFPARGQATLAGQRLAIDPLDSIGAPPAAGPRSVRIQQRGPAVLMLSADGPLQPAVDGLQLEKMPEIPPVVPAGWRLGGLDPAILASLLETQTRSVAATRSELLALGEGASPGEEELLRSDLSVDLAVLELLQTGHYLIRYAPSKVLPSGEIIMFGGPAVGPDTIVTSFAGDARTNGYVVACCVEKRRFPEVFRLHGLRQWAGPGYAELVEEVEEPNEPERKPPGKR